MKKEIKPLNFTVDARSVVPVYEQVKQAIKLYILSGYLVEGDQLMSIRELGAMVKIHPNTIAKVYYQLEVEGFVYSQPGSGYYVKHDPNRTEPEKRRLLQKIIDEALSRVIQLGFTPLDMQDELNRKIKESEPGNHETRKE